MKKQKKVRKMNKVKGKEMKKKKMTTKEIKK